MVGTVQKLDHSTPDAIETLFDDFIFFGFRNGVTEGDVDAFLGDLALRSNKAERDTDHEARNRFHRAVRQYEKDRSEEIKRVAGSGPLEFFLIEFSHKIKFVTAGCY